MKTLGVRFCIAAFAIAAISLTGKDSQAAGPAAAQQLVTQAQSALTEASVGWHRWGGYYGGWGGYRGYGWGGGYRGYGWGGYRGYGWGGYGYGYPAYGWRSYGYGYPYYGGGYYGGYGGWGYSRPVVYSYPSYSYYQTPVYYSNYSYSSPYQSSYGCGCSSYGYYGANTSTSPYSSTVVYSTPTYTAPTYTTSTYSTPTYSTTQSYGTSSSDSTYVPTYSTPTYSTPTVTYPRSTTITVPVAAPYPAPPMEYSQPAESKPVAAVPVQNMYATLPTAVTYSIVSYPTPNQHAAYMPGTYQYSSVSQVSLPVGYRTVW